MQHFLHLAVGGGDADEFLFLTGPYLSITVAQILMHGLHALILRDPYRPSLVEAGARLRENCTENRFHHSDIFHDCRALLYFDSMGSAEVPRDENGKNQQEPDIQSNGSFPSSLCSR